VGSGHLLLGLLVENEGVAAETLTRPGIGPEEARRRVPAAIAAAPEAPPRETTSQPRSAIARANARAREIAAQLSQVRAAKDAAREAGDLVGATAMREREKALLAERAELATDLQPDRRTPPGGRAARRAAARRRRPRTGSLPWSRILP
jgi:ATP-dependent Clp protease ATP-binding subunit ClpA